MKFKISEQEKEYLKSACTKEDLIFSDILKGDSNILDIDEYIADMIRDWANNKLQVVGFDLNYNLTDEGKILESLVDKLFH